MRARPDLDDLRPYRSSDTSAGRVWLHANENPYPLPEAIRDEIAAAARRLELNRYPLPEATELREALADYAGVHPDWVWVGDGSNEVLLQACLAYGGPGRTALLFEPTYRMHHRQARIAGTAVDVRWRRRADFAVEVPEEISADVVFVCTPNNPTGTATPVEDLRRIADSAPGLVVVDEAYYEFCGRTFLPELGGRENVLLSRTLSKAFRLAGLRLGYGIAHPSVLEPFYRVRMPYGLSAFTQAAALVVLKHRDEMLSVVGDLVGERDRLWRELSALDAFEVFPSEANFLLFRPPDPRGLMDALGAEGVVIRDFSDLPGCEGCLRVTVGRPEENDAFLEAVARFAGGR